MFLTLEILEQYGACENGKKWFARYFPDGGELIDVITHKYVTPEVLHWGYTHLATTVAEQEAYWNKLEVNAPHRWSIYESDKITNSTYVSRCSRVKDSTYVFSSKDIIESHNISSCANVERSNQIFGSEFVYDSAEVCQSNNINQSVNIVNSDYVVRSSSIMNSAVVTNSHYVYGLVTGHTRQIKGSAFITDCRNLKNCLFCAYIENGEYLLFNKPIDPDQFDMIMNQMKSLLAEWRPEFIKGEWPKETVPLDAPQIQRNIIKQFAGLPEQFWRWVKTLPEYNPSILYSITFQAKMIS